MAFSNLFLSVLCVLIVILGLFLLIKSLVQKMQIFWFARNYPGYTFYPFLGNEIHIFGKNTFDVIQNLSQKFRFPCNLWIGHSYYYVTADAAEIKTVLTHPNTFDKMDVYQNMLFGFKNTLLLAPADVWKTHRKYFSKSFSQSLLNTFINIFYKKSNVLLKLLKTVDERTDLFYAFERYTLDCFYETIIGLESDLQVDPEVRIVEKLAEVQDISGKWLFVPFYWVFVWAFSNTGRRLLKVLHECHLFVQKAVQEKIKSMENDQGYVDDGTPLPLLDSMLRVQGDKFSLAQIKREMALFTGAGIDTTGYTLTYVFTLLGMHPAIQERLYQEIDNVIGSDRTIYFSDLPNLKYTERVIFESLRLLPAVPIIGRKATDITDIGTKVLPKDTNVLISIIDLHRNEKYWPDPLKFDPDRFLAEEVAKRDTFAFIPFSGGPRSCIGKTYSIMLMKTCVANVVRNYEIWAPYKSVKELKFKSCITMKTVNHLECRFKPRMYD